jgi:hypothetical protein
VVLPPPLSARKVRKHLSGDALYALICEGIEAIPAAAGICQDFYEQMDSRYGVHKRARVIAHSHRGLIAYGWAFRHPAGADRIAAE